MHQIACPTRGKILVLAASVKQICWFLCFTNLCKPVAMFLILGGKVKIFYDGSIYERDFEMMCARYESFINLQCYVENIERQTLRLKVKEIQEISTVSVPKKAGDIMIAGKLVTINLFRKKWRVLTSFLTEYKRGKIYNNLTFSAPFLNKVVKCSLLELFYCKSQAKSGTAKCQR